MDIGRLAACTTLYALVEGFLTYPYDLIKTRQQVLAPMSGAVQLGTFEQMSQLRASRGFGALYRGFGWNVLGGLPSEIAYYVGYTKAKNIMLASSIGQNNPSAVYMAAGALAEALSVLLWVPADLISQRLQLAGADMALQPIPGSLPRATASPQPQHPSVPSVATCSHAPLSVANPTGVQILRRLIREEGLLGMWRGTGATIAYLTPNSAVWWLTHEQAKAHLSRRFGTHDEHPGTLALSGSLAGICATVATNPLDVVKTRVQCAQTPLPVMAVARGMLAEAGWHGLYSGLAPRLMAAVPRSVFTVLAYERAISYCRVDTCAAAGVSIGCTAAGAREGFRV